MFIKPPGGLRLMAGRRLGWGSADAQIRGLKAKVRLLAPCTFPSWRPQALHSESRPSYITGMGLTTRPQGPELALLVTGKHPVRTQQGAGGSGESVALTSVSRACKHREPAALGRSRWVLPQRAAADCGLRRQRPALQRERGGPGSKSPSLPAPVTSSQCLPQPDPPEARGQAAADLAPGEHVPSSRADTGQTGQTKGQIGQTERQPAGRTVRGGRWKVSLEKHREVDQPITGSRCAQAWPAARS